MNRILLTISIIIAAVSLSVSIYLYSRQQNTAYVDLSKLNNSFVYKIELEKKFEKNQLAKKNILDSLKLNLSLLESNVKANKDNKELLTKYQILGEDYYYKEQQFEEDTKTLQQQYTDQIWNQLNQYIEEFGQKTGYTYIFGANGSGSLMYSDKKKNITDELIEFVNNRHKGI